MTNRPKYSQGREKTLRTEGLKGIPVFEEVTLRFSRSWSIKKEDQLPLNSYVWIVSDITYLRASEPSSVKRDTHA